MWSSVEASQRCNTFLWWPLKDTFTHECYLSAEYDLRGELLINDSKLALTRKQALPGRLSSRLFLFFPRNSLPEPTE